MGSAAVTIPLTAAGTATAKANRIFLNINLSLMIIANKGNRLPSARKIAGEIKEYSGLRQESHGIDLCPGHKVKYRGE